MFYNHAKLSKAALIYFVFVPITCGYMLTAFFGQVNAVVAPYIVQDIHLSTAATGVMTAVFLLGFALAQIPIGIMLDRSGAKNVQVCLFTVAAIGMFIFASAHSYQQLLLGRLLIGIGVAGGLMGGFKAMREYMPSFRISIMNGTLMALGSAGGLFATAPVKELLAFMSWRQIIYGVGAFSLFNALLILLLVPKRVPSTHRDTFKHSMLVLRKIYRSAYFWRIAPVSALIFAMSMSMMGLWADQWFVYVSHLTPMQSAQHLFLMTISLILGIILNGVIADIMTTYFKKPITHPLSFGLGLFIVVECLIVYTAHDHSYLLWCLFGFLGRNITLSYVAVSNHFPLRYTARSVAALNLVFFITAFCMQIAFGCIVSHWPKLPNGGHAVIAYKTAFIWCMVLQVIAYIWMITKNYYKVSVNQVLLSA